MSGSAGKAGVPQVAVPRLAGYLRLLKRLERQGLVRVSSREMADHLGANAAQIRKDLSYFGEFGVRGVGYDVKFLVSALSRCLGIDREWNVVILGAGQLGLVSACLGSLRDGGFNCVGIFDSDAGVSGCNVGGLAIRPIDQAADFIRDNGVQIAVVAVPPESAVEVAALAVEGGVKGILNLAPVPLPSAPGVFIHQLDLFTELTMVSFHVSQE